MTRKLRLSMVLALGLGNAIGLSSGCSSEPKAVSQEAAEDHTRRTKVSELGEMLYLHKGDFGKAPSSVSTLAKYEAGFQLGYLGVKSGDVILAWGAPLQEGASDKILAYEKSAPESGGYVLMQDGTTVKKLTADEFKAAPLVAGSKPAGEATK